MNKYGVENVFQLGGIKEKSKQTKLEKYGDENFVNAIKAEETKLRKYGNLHYVNAEKRNETVYSKYGVNNILQNTNIQNRVKETVQNKYGVDYYCLTDDCRNALYHSNDSKPNKEFSKLLENNNISYNREFRLNNYFYDFKINDTLIEINPSPTHNSTWGLYDKNPMEKNYHSNKSNCARLNGFRCIHIWDWDDKNKIINLLLPRQKIYARNCTIKEIDKNISSEFINKYHLQGDAKADIFIGLFYKDEPVSIMTFGKPRYNKKYQYELVRYCSNKNIIGGSNKLFTYFIRKYNPNSIISYCDLSKFNGNTYEKLGFKLKSINIGKHWYNLKTKQHITDNLLRQRGYDQIFHTNYGKWTSNRELMLQNGFVELYDSGQATYIICFEGSTTNESILSKKN